MRDVATFRARMSDRPVERIDLRRCRDHAINDPEPGAGTHGIDPRLVNLHLASEELDLTRSEQGHPARELAPCKRSAL